MEEKLINLTIDGRNISVPAGTTILEAARKAGIDIPTLCFLKEINEVGDCRICLVEVEGRRGFATSCIQKVEEGMVVYTNSKDVIEARKVVLDLIISNHKVECLTCVRSWNCELQELAKKYNVKDIEYKGEMKEHNIDDLSPSIVRDFDKCILKFDSYIKDETLATEFIISNNLEDTYDINEYQVKFKVEKI